MKRKGILGGIFAMVLILVLALALGVGSVSAAEPTIVDSGNCGKDGSNVTWTLDSTGLLTISGEGQMADNAGGTAQWGNRAKSVSIQNGVTSIGANAFRDCTGLTSVTIGSGVTSIGDYAFRGCTGLKEVIYNARAAECSKYNVFQNAGTASGGMKVVFGESVEKIPSELFYNCTALTGVTIPDGVTSIGERAFSGCTGLKEVIYNAKAAECSKYDVFQNAGTAAVGMKVVFGKSVEKIPSNIFYNCESLTSVTILDSVTSIGDWAFSGCAGLTSVTIPDSVTSIGDYAFRGCTGLTSVTIPDSVTSIGERAFSGCTGLTSVTIGNGVTSIGDYAFCGCTGLKEVIYNAKAITDGSYAFKGAGTAAVGMKVVFGESVEKIPSNIFYNCESLTSVTILDSVTSIGDWAFSGCTGLTSVTIPDSVTSIGDYAFRGCTGLKEVIYNAKAAECSEYNVFQNAGTAADGMKVVFGESVEKIPNELFYNCTGLTGVTIGRNVTSIGREAFRGCTSLTEINYNARRADDLDGSTDAFYDVGAESEGVVVKFGEDVEVIPACLFYTNTPTPKIKIVSVSVGNRVTEIGEYAFCNCVNLTSLKLGNSVSTIGSEAFGSCKKLSSITGIEGVKQIGYSTFRYCSSLETFTIGENLTRIGANAFYKCIGLKEVYYNAKAAEDLESSLSGVFQYAGGSGGVRVIFGENVKKIPAYLFCNAKNIRSFIFTGNPPTVGSRAFRDNYAYALYPGHNSEWTETVREACGSHLTWIGYCTEPVSSAACRIDQTAYLPNDTLNTQGLCMTLTHKDGCTETIPYDSGLLELGSCDMSTPGAKTIDVTYRGTTAQLKIYVHERKTQTLDKKGYPESSHNYENNLDKTYTYKAAGAVSLDVTFSAQTEVETNIDYLYVNGAQYTGTELAGKTISIQGDTLTIRLVSDKGDSAYGFSIDRIVKTYIEHQYKNGVCTPCGAKDPNYKLTAPSVKTDYLLSTGKPYLKWKAVDGAVKYYVYRSGSKSGTYQYIGTATKLNYTDTTAKPGYYYYYKVKAVNASGVKSSYSAAVTALCHCARPELNSAQYLSSSGKPYLSWGAVTGAGKYYVYRAGSQNGSYKYIGSTTKTNYTDTTASAGYTYYYKVEAVSKVRSAANSANSKALAVNSHCARPVVKPDYLASSGKPYLKWSAVTGASKYEVYRAGSQNGTYKYIGSTTKTNYTDTTASAGYAYYYKVKAVSKVKTAANSAYSTVVKATCHCAKPVVKITTSSGKPKLTWNAVAGAGKYEVYRATSKNGTYTKMFTTTNRSYTNTNARAGTTYYYKVKAISRVRSAANSSYSVVKSIRAR